MSLADSSTRLTTLGVVETAPTTTTVVPETMVSAMPSRRASASVVLPADTLTRPVVSESSVFFKGLADFVAFARVDVPQDRGAFANFSSNRKTGICYAFERGECDRGDRCRFSHGAASGDRGAPRSKGVCYAFQRGECERGDQCRYSHEAQQA